MSESKENSGSKGTAVTEEDFNLAHLLKKSGLNLTETARIIKRSGSTTNLLLQADSLEGYKAEVRKITSKAKPQAKPAEESKATPVSIDTSSLETKIDNLTEAVITLTAVMNQFSTTQIADKKLFFRR